MGDITEILLTPMLSPFGIIIRIRCLHQILSENKADSSIFPGAVQFLISPKYNVFQSTQAASTCAISFYVFIPMKINTVYLSSFIKKFDSSALISRMKLTEYPSYSAARPVTNSCPLLIRSGEMQRLSFLK